MKMKWKMMPVGAVCGWLVAGAMAAVPVWAPPQSAAKTTHPGTTAKKPVTHRAAVHKTVVHKTPVHKTAKGRVAAAKRPGVEAAPAKPVAEAAAVSRPRNQPYQATMDRVHAWVQDQQKNSGTKPDAVAPVKSAAAAPGRAAMPLTPTRAAKPAAGRPMIPAAAPAAPVAEVNKATAADFDKAVEKQAAEKPKLTTGVSQPEDERMTARKPMPEKPIVPADAKPAQELKPVMIPTPEPKSAAPETKQQKDIAVVAGKSAAPGQPKLMYVHGRLVVPEPLKGSHEILVHQNEVADREGLSRVEDDEDLSSMRAKKQLVALPVSGALRADERLPRDRRYARPWTVKFLTDLARAHYAKFHEAVQVNSAVRTVDVQLH